MDDIFGSFFGGGGGGFGGGGRGNHGFHEEEEKAPDMFETTDVITLDLGSVFKFYRRQEIWVLYFFDAKKKECQDFKEEYSALADKLYGIIKVGAIDCKNEEELCEEFSIYDNPQVMIYSENYGDDGERFRGKMQQGPIANAAAKKMQSFVSFVSDGNYLSFVDRERMEKNKVLLFTDKKSTPAVFKALSKKYLGKLIFGEVRKSDTDLCEKFGITVFPTIMALTDPDNHAGEAYSADFKVDQL